MTILYGLAGAIALLALVSFLWRVASRHIHLPCPASLAFLLENPFTDAVESAGLLLDRAGIAAGMSVLDAGCGPGRLTVPAAQRVGAAGSVTAIDMQARMLDRLRLRLEKNAISNVRVIHGGLGDGLLPAATFDRAFLVTVLGEIPDALAALREIHRALKPGGILSITEVLGDPHYQRIATVQRLAAEVGFETQPPLSTWWTYTMNLVKRG